MVRILHIETATDICSATISENDLPVYSKETYEPFRHASALTSFIQDCSRSSGVQLKDLDAVSVSGGPGSYTGLRVGVSTAKGICYGLDIPLISVDTLHSLAWKMLNQLEKPNNVKTYICPMIDARRMEVYTAVYDTHLNPIVPTKALIINETSLGEELKQCDRLLVGGNGSQKTLPIIKNSKILHQDVQCAASHLVAIAFTKYNRKMFENLAHYVPNYLKMPNITTSKK